MRLSRPSAIGHHDDSVIYFRHLPFIIYVKERLGRRSWIAADRPYGSNKTMTCLALLRTEARLGAQIPFLWHPV
jgi:hypothetical protein